MQEKNSLIYNFNIENNRNLYDILHKVILNHVSDAILIHGNEGIGKYDFIVSIIDEYFKNDEIKKASNLHILGNNFDDILIEDARLAVDFLSLNPFYSEKKFLIINGIDLMNKNAINAILKSCEDIASNTIIIALDSKRNELIKTINSRFKKFNFNALLLNQFQSIIKIKDLEELEFYFYFTKGSYFKTVLFQQINLYFYYKEILDFIFNNKFGFIEYFFIKLENEIKKKKLNINHKLLCYNLFLYSSIQSKDHNTIDLLKLIIKK